MERFKRALPAIILAALSSLYAAPARPAALPEITTVGGGSDACSRWTDAIKEPGARHQYQQWLFGFISGYNWRDASKQVKPATTDALLSWIDAFCKVNPDVPIYMAAARLTRQMEKPSPTGGAAKKPETKR